MPKRTFQPNRRHRAKTHGFLTRMKTKQGAAVLSAPRQGPAQDRGERGIPRLVERSGLFLKGIVVRKRTSAAEEAAENLVSLAKIDLSG